MQITTSVSQSVRPVVSNGNQCYLITSRFTFWIYYLHIIFIHFFLFCLKSDLYIYFAFSINDIFPQVSLNFAGGASMILRPQDYLIQQSSVVSFLVGYFQLVWTCLEDLLKHKMILSSSERHLLL